MRLGAMPRQQSTTPWPSENELTTTTTPWMDSHRPRGDFAEDNAASDYMSIMTNFGEQEGQAERARLQREKEAADIQAMLERKLKLVDVLER